MAALYYLTLLCLLFDLLRLANRLIGFVPANWRLSPVGIGGGIVLIVACILAYGAWNATHTVWRSYEIELDKAAGDLQIADDVERHVKELLVELGKADYAA